MSDHSIVKGQLLEAQRDLAQRKAAAAAIDLEVAQQRLLWAKASDMDNRVYRFDGEVNYKSCGQCYEWLSRCFRMDPEQLVDIRLTTGGGDVWAGMALIDEILALREQGLKVRWTARGAVASMGVFLMQSASEGERVGGPSCTYLLHKIQLGGGEGGGLSGSLDQIEDITAWVKLMQKRGNALLAERSNMTERQIAAGLNRKEWSMDSDEALDLGIIDRIG